MTQGFAQLCSAAVISFVINAFIRVPDLGKADPRIRVHMPSKSMNDKVTGLIRPFQAVNGLKPASVPHKPVDSIPQPGRIIRMDIPVCIVIHGIIDLRTVI